MQRIKLANWLPQVPTLASHDLGGREVAKGFHYPKSRLRFPCKFVVEPRFKFGV